MYSLKARPTHHPLIVHLPGSEALWEWADKGVQSRRGVDPATIGTVVDALWPGPLTLVLWAAPAVSRAITGGQDTVAVRVPANDTALAILSGFGAGVVAPSANRFGMVSPTTAAHVVAEFADADVDLLVLDGGATRLGLESTVVDMTTTRPRLLRPGALLPAAVEDLLGTTLVAAARGGPRAPGTLKKHYAPSTPLRLGPAASLAARSGDVAVIARFPEPTTRAAGKPGPGAGDPSAPWLVLPADAQGFAHDLYAAIRLADGAGARLILVEEPPAGEAWLAVRDRLERAAAAHGAGGGD